MKYLTEYRDADGEEVWVHGDLLPGNDTAGDPEETALRGELAAAIARATARLTARQQAIVRALAAGTNPSDISRALNLPRPTLYDELARIRTRFDGDATEVIVGWNVDSVEEFLRAHPGYRTDGNSDGGPEGDGVDR